MDFLDAVLLLGAFALVAQLGTRGRERRLRRVRAIWISVVGAVVVAGLTTVRALATEPLAEPLSQVWPFLGVAVCLSMTSYFALESSDGDESLRRRALPLGLAAALLACGGWLAWRECLSPAQLERAINHADSSRVGWLAWFGARVQGRGYDHLSWAIRRGDADVVRALVSHGRTRATEEHRATQPLFEWHGTPESLRWLGRWSWTP